MFHVASITPSISWKRRRSVSHATALSAATVPGIGGRLRTEPEDFQVDERPLYLPSGEGEHLYIKVTKRLLSTPDLVRRIIDRRRQDQGVGTAVSRMREP